MKPASWVIVDLATGEPIFETFDFKKVQNINKAKYKAVEILEWLQSLNARQRAYHKSTIKPED